MVNSVCFVVRRGVDKVDFFVKFLDSIDHLVVFFERGLWKLGLGDWVVMVTVK